MATHFTLKLPTGHAVLTMSPSAALDMLRRDALTPSTSEPGCWRSMALALPTGSRQGAAASAAAPTLRGGALGPPAAGGGKDSSCNRLRMAESGSLRRRPGGLSSTGTWGFRRAAGGRRAAKYPRSGLLKYVAEQRAVQSSVQSSELDAFLEEVER